MPGFIRILMAIFATALIYTTAASAQDLPVPEGPVLLRVSGEIAVTNDGDSAIFDLAMLRDLDTRTIRTSTIWTDGVQDFTGVPLHAVIERLGISSGSLRARAINDYAVDIPLEDAQLDHALIAFERGGKPMSVRDKGPLWIIYPFDENPDFQAEVYYTRSIWQLDRIEVLP